MCLKEDKIKIFGVYLQKKYKDDTLGGSEWRTITTEIFWKIKKVTVDSVQVIIVSNSNLKVLKSKIN